MAYTTQSFNLDHNKCYEAYNYLQVKPLSENYVFDVFKTDSYLMEAFIKIIVIFNVNFVFFECLTLVNFFTKIEM